MVIKYSKNNTCIWDGYKYSLEEIEEMVDEIITIRKNLGFKVTRNKRSYIHQWVAINWLYKLGYQRSRTKDINLEENIKPINQSIYNLLGRWGKK